MVLRHYHTTCMLTVKFNNNSLIWMDLPVRHWLCLWSCSTTLQYMVINVCCTCDISQWYWYCTQQCDMVILLHETILWASLKLSCNLRTIQLQSHLYRNWNWENSYSLLKHHNWSVTMATLMISPQMIIHSPVRCSLPGIVALKN